MLFILDQSSSRTLLRGAVQPAAQRPMKALTLPSVLLLSFESELI
jgi:hypothetical protein